MKSKRDQINDALRYLLANYHQVLVDFVIHNRITEQEVKNFAAKEVAKTIILIENACENQD